MSLTQVILFGSWYYMATLADESAKLYRSTSGWEMSYGQNDRQGTVLFASPDGTITRITGNDLLGQHLADEVVAAANATAAATPALELLLAMLMNKKVKIVVDPDRFKDTSVEGLFSEGVIYLSYSPEEKPDNVWHEAVHFLQWYKAFGCDYLTLDWDVTAYLPKQIGGWIINRYPEESWGIEREAFAVMFSNELKQETLALLSEVKLIG